MITIRQWRPVAVWQWECGRQRECGICQSVLEAACPACQLPGDECPVVKGRCQHPYHQHCIVKWTAAQLEAAANNELLTEPVEPYCPMCRQRWELSVS